MPLLKVDLWTPNGVELINCAVPDNLTSQELVSDLVIGYGLATSAADGRPITYSLEIVEQGRIIPREQTLAQAGVSERDIIRLKPSCKIDDDATDLIVATPAEEKEQTVVVSLSALLELMEKNRAPRAPNITFTDASIAPEVVDQETPQAVKAGFFTKHKTIILFVALIFSTGLLFLPIHRSEVKVANVEDLVDVDPTPTPTPIPVVVPPPAQTEILPEPSAPAPIAKIARKERPKASAAPTPEPVVVAAQQPGNEPKKCSRWGAFWGRCSRDKSAGNNTDAKKSSSPNSNQGASGMITSTLKSSAQSAVRSSINSSIQSVVR